MRIAVAQLDPVVGAFDANVQRIREAYERACSEQARLLMTPEMAVCGYPPHDLLERPEMLEFNERAVAELAKITKGKSTALIVGYISRNEQSFGRPARNTVSVLEGGKIVFTQAKTLLPTYDVFDEARWFEPAEEVKAWECDGRRIALAICEDLWGNDPSFGRKLYGVDPVVCYQREKVDLLLSLSASPYFVGKLKKREQMHADVARTLGVPLVYVNQVGATDEILFDGGSFALSEKGELLGRLPVFKSAFGVFDTDKMAWEAPLPAEREDSVPLEIEMLSRALVAGIQEYFSKTGFKSAVLGLSGGIDSAVVATLAAKALGPGNVLGVAMPSQFSSSHSLEDAEQLARNLGIGFEVRPIKFLYATASRELAEGRGQLAPLAQENLQARLRGNVLMTLSNHYGALVLTTGNKSEIAVGYCTLYGDMCGALAPIGDVFKTRVYELARYLNQVWGNPIPERSITKPPSAELRPDQKDQDSLPPYEELDRFLESYIEKSMSVTEAGKGFPPEMVKDVIRKVEFNEYKRRQGAPVLKVSQKAFGIGRRIPIAKRWPI